MLGLRHVVAGSLLVIGLVACGESGGTGSSSASGSSAGSAGANLGTATVKISATDALKFDPAQQTAHVGDIVEWDNSGSTGHTVTFDSQPGLSDVSLGGGGTWQVKFTAAGTYAFHCTIHSGMSGTVNVS